MNDKNKQILIVGGGTFGLSTAYHLAKSGYTSVSVLERSSFIPAEDSAGNDEAIYEWTNSPLFAPYYHQVGYLLCNSLAAPDKAKRTLAKSLSSMSKHPAWAGKIAPINSREDIRKVAPVFDGPMEWRGYFNRLAGYAHSADALHAVYAACCELGVSLLLGDGAERLAFDGRRCTGVYTDSGEMHSADVGFFFEPDPRTNLPKLCPLGAGITNFNGEGVSLLPGDSSYIPLHDEEASRRIQRETLPALAERPLVHKKMCWVADTDDSDYLIDCVPGTEGLIVASGDSGHGFEMLPTVGGWVRRVVEDGRQVEARWRWKPGRGKKSGDDVSWRVGELYDLGEEKTRSKL